ncbi:glutaminyl-peptide cyclotransferase [Kitasatospora sp. NPDC059088]|uniref:glutaminyl-peptide cyclotransferase n=1 Tax=Kitasatospora sp. NPDC059088 TaxID=3346722 RepID=UPI00368C9A5D
MALLPCLSEAGHFSEALPNGETLKRTATVHELFARQAERTPDVIAVHYQRERLTYAQLEAEANRFAHQLVANGVAPGDLVGLMLPRSTELVVALIGILKAGAGYLPIDPTTPALRRAAIIRDARPAALVIDHANAAWSDAVPQHSVTLHVDRESLQAGPAVPPPLVRHRADGTMYVLYTSGSTGQPKGVVLEHGGIVNILTWMVREYGFSERDRVLQKTPFTFDASVWEFFVPLISGGTLVLVEPEMHRDPAYLVETVATMGITTLQVVPSMLQLLIEQGGLERCRSLRHLFCGGESLSHQLQDAFLRTLPVPLYNLYGPTEASIQVMTWACQPDTSRDHVPIGRPIDNVGVYVLDGSGCPVEDGAAGELYLGGVALARGYLGDRKLTDASFVTRTDACGKPIRLYRTRDIVRRHWDGVFEFVGRADEQIKLRGHRVEVGEVEACLREFPGVRQAAVVLQDSDGAASEHLAAHIETGDGQMTIPDLQKWLADRLPEYMLPSRFRLLGSLPRTAHGKVDKKQLAYVPVPLTAQEPPGAKAARTEGPLTHTEQLLGDAWHRALGVRAVDMEQDFFSAGGNSAAGATFITQAACRGVPVTLRQLFKLRTIRAIAADCDAATGAGGRSAPTSLGSGERVLRRAYRVERQFPHDPGAFTQGLVARGQVLYESTGGRGQSEVRAVDLASGRILRRHRLEDRYFGEGVAELGGMLYQLTYQEGTLFIYDSESLTPLGAVSYESEGWGLAAHDGGLIMSDGSSKLYTLSPETGQREVLFEVTDGGRPLSGLNDLDAAGGLIYANVYPTDQIVIIDGRTGTVVSSVDLGALRPASARDEGSVLNGIAHDPSTGRLLVTGKRWDRVYEVALHQSTSAAS